MFRGLINILLLDLDSKKLDREHCWVSGRSQNMAGGLCFDCLVHHGLLQTILSTKVAFGDELPVKWEGVFHGVLRQEGV